MQCMRVDLPDPEGPITAVNSAVTKSTVTPSRAAMVAEPAPYSLRRSIARAAIAVPVAAEGVTGESDMRPLFCGCSALGMT